MSKSRKTARAKTPALGELDDLTAIEGIGGARQKWLRESLGVNTYGDLACLSADKIEAQLKSEGQVASRSAIESWIAQADELAVAPNRRVPTRELENDEPSHLPADEPEWLPFASFVVEFQSRTFEGTEALESPSGYRTAVHHIEADENEAWLGIASQQLSDWMLERTDYEVQRKPRTDTSSEGRPTGAQRVVAPRSVKIAEIRLFQRPEAEAPRGVSVLGGAFSGSVKGNEPFTSEVMFSLTAAAASNAAERGERYKLQFYAENLATAARTYLGDTTPVSVAADRHFYSAVLAERTLPAGIYRLTVLAQREGDGVFPAQLEEPLLRVV